MVSFLTWCDNYNLELNISKTNELLASNMDAAADSDTWRLHTIVQPGSTEDLHNQSSFKTAPEDQRYQFSVQHLPFCPGLMVSTSGQKSVFAARYDDSVKLTFDILDIHCHNFVLSDIWATFCHSYYKKSWVMAFNRLILKGVCPHSVLVWAEDHWCSGALRWSCTSVS